MGECGEHEPAFVVESAQLGQVHGDVDARAFDRFGQLLQRLQLRGDGFGKLLPRPLDHFHAAVQRGEHGEIARAHRVLLLHGVEQLLGAVGVHPRHHRAVDRGVSQVDVDARDARDLQRRDHQPHDLDVGLQARVPVELGADLDRLAHLGHARGHGVQDASAVAQARDSLAIQQVRVDARDLRGVVGAHPEHAPRELVDQLEGGQLHVAPGAREQRLEVLEQRRGHQLVAVGLEEVEDRPAQALDGARFAREHVLDVLGQ